MNVVSIYGHVVIRWVFIWSSNYELGFSYGHSYEFGFYMVTNLWTWFQYDHPILKLVSIWSSSSELKFLYGHPVLNPGYKYKVRLGMCHSTSYWIF